MGHNCDWRFTHGTPPTFMPGTLDTSRMHDITTPADPYRVFYEPETGQTHRGADYARQATAAGTFSCWISREGDKSCDLIYGD